MASANKQLYHACRNGDRDRAEELIDGGADVNWNDGQGWTPLMAAAMSGCANVVALILDRGAEYLGQPEVNRKNCYGSTALHRAARYGRDEVVQELVDRGADTTIKNNQGQVPLDIARKYRKTTIIRILEEAMTNGEKELKNYLICIVIPGIHCYQYLQVRKYYAIH